MRGSLEQYLGEDEQVLLSTRQHPFALVRALADTCLLLLPFGLVAWGIGGIELLRGDVGTWIVRLLLASMLVVVLRLGWRVLGWELERVVVTSQKVVHRSGVLSQRIASTPIAKVSEFTVHQPLLGRMYGYGSLVVDVPGGREQALHGLAYLPDPASIYRLVASGGAGVRQRDTAPAPSAADLDRIVVAAPDPWVPALPPEQADHTIEIPRVSPRP